MTALPADHPMVEGWRIRELVNADCPTCGGRMTDGFAPSGSREEDQLLRAKARKWARAHAMANPGHTAVVEVVVGRAYKVVGR